ncbi:hypothetical protein F5141DRAFT_24654 [Pisolithus sp. B1]|nr:hypothetical protein F5141DRAFT_24654 [Pisolithus sp. B1]
MKTKARQASLSPSPKRMRLSSPTYDDQVEGLSQDDISAFDAANALLSQPSLTSLHEAPPETPKPPQAHHAHDVITSLATSDDEDDPFSSRAGVDLADNIHVPHKALVGALFLKASALSASSLPAIQTDDPGDSSSHTLQDVEYSSCFESSKTTPFSGFKTAATALQNREQGSGGALDAGVSEGFFVPSAAAFLKAKQKMKLWQEEEEAAIHASQQHDSGELTSSVVSPQMTMCTPASKPLLSPMPETPVPTTHGIVAGLPQFTSIRHPKQFKSPLVGTITNSPLRESTITNINTPLSGSGPSFVLPSQLPSSTPRVQSSQRQLGFTTASGRSAAKPRFVTPFKGGKRPTSWNTTPSRTPTALQFGTVSSPIYPRLTARKGSDDRPAARNGVSAPAIAGRPSLASSTLRPQSYRAEELQGFGIDIKELMEINPRTALSYSFGAQTSSSGTSRSAALGHAAALEELQAKGCSLATKAWVENHWSLVLWKLAGMVALDPRSELDPDRRRWCWSEAMRQLLYRYERDLNGSTRPPLRLIVTRDASVESPMVLCISNVTWPNGEADENGPSAAPYPELEVTDGWYRLRARVDEPLARATRKGILRIGRKIAVAAAKLSSQRKEGSEILEAYDSTTLVINGNSSHMAPWHAKLGFQKTPFIATLNSLTPDGGNVAAMVIEIIKAYPVAYIEFVDDERGRKRRDGPRGEKEETELHSQWQRELEAAKLWATYEERWSTMCSYAERLEERARSVFSKHGEPPDNIHDLYDALKEDPAMAKKILSSTSPQDAGWLVRHIQDKNVQEREEAEREIERELEALCPAREVKDFCVLVVKDAHTSRRPPNRTAQITVWDAVSLTTSEDSMKGFETGQRYLVTNLIPTQPSAWMGRSAGSVVYLATKRNSRWTLIP